MLVGRIPGELGFHNITALEKKAAEVFASLITQGPGANAWWGAGVYSVPKPPDQWADRHQLLDNNFRNMMRRDLQDRGASYVNEKYPPRAGFRHYSSNTFCVFAVSWF